MKILYIGNKLSRYGKNPTSVETLGPLLSEHYECILISDRKNKILRMLHIVWVLVKERKNVEVTLIDTYSSWAFYFAKIAGIISSLFNIPYVLILRGGDLEKRLKKSNNYSLFVNAFRMIAPSKFMLSLFSKYDYKNLVYIPNTIFLRDYSFEKKIFNNYNLFWVRAFQDIYNPLMAIELLNNLLKTGKEAKLCMVGPDKDGSMKICKDRIYELGIQEKVLITGKLSKESWRELSKKYNIFLNTSWVDNTPVSVIEAMALGLVVVSTNVGGVPYLLDHEEDSLLVDPGQVDQMYTEVVKAIETDLGPSLAIKARAKVEQFDWAKVKEEWFALFQELDKLRKND